MSHPIITVKVNDVELATIADFVPAQIKDAFCDEKKQLVGTLCGLFIFNKYGLLVRKARLDWSTEKLVLISLRAAMLYMAHNFTLEGHPANDECTACYFTISTGLILPLTFIV